MANITSYPPISELKSGDIIVVSDTSTTKNATKTTTVGDIAKLLVPGTVTGDGVTNKLPLWSDGPNRILKSSNLTQDPTTLGFRLDDYTATAVETTGSLDPNQNFQALTQDTLADLCVDPSGNIVRGSQEGTWTFTKAELDALAIGPTGGITLIDAPPENYAVVIEESTWMVKYSGVGTMNVTQAYEIRQGISTNVNASISRLPSTKINEIMNEITANPGYGFYSRDVPDFNNDARTYDTNQLTRINRLNTNATPANLTSVSVKLKYRIFNGTTF